MMLIRLKRRSSGSKITYSIVVTSNKVSTKSNQFIEKIGHYNPLVDSWCNKYLFLDFDRLKFWVERGARINIGLFTLIRAWLNFSYHPKRNLVCLSSFSKQNIKNTEA